MTNKEVYYRDHIAEEPYNLFAHSLLKASKIAVDPGGVNWTEVAKYVMHNFQEKPKDTVDFDFTAPGIHQDDLVNYFFALTMKQKMDFARQKYGDGWRYIDRKDLWTMLREHVEKGDPVDVANFAMFIWWLQINDKLKDNKVLRGNTESVQYVDDAGLVNKPNMSKDNY